MLRLNNCEPPSSPVQKVWKPELYKIQLEAPTPKPLLRTRPLDNPPSCYGAEYHGELGNRDAEQLLGHTVDGSFLLRRSPNAQNYYTLSVRFNGRTKHFKIFHRRGEGHFLLPEAARAEGGSASGGGGGANKLYDSVHELVADGLITFYMQLHAAPILQQMNQQTQNCYQQSPYMTLNRRKLRALSNELRKSIVAKANGESDISVACPTQTNNNNDGGSCANSKDAVAAAVASDAADPILPLVYEKAHTFKLHTFKGLNWCEVCANFLWGFTAQGVKCEACGFVAHSKCSELVPAKCVPDLKRIRGIFGTDLTTMVQLHQCSIPFVVRRCVEEVEARGMLQEGIYRVSGFADEIDALKLALDREGEKTDMSEAAYGNVNVIAGTLKLYLRLLPVPLITFQAYPSFMQAARTSNTAEQIRNTNEAAKKLPLAHFHCLKFMMEHLKRVASHYAANKMNEHNLATVFAPTLIATPQHMTNLTEEIYMLSSLITNCEAIFT